MSQRVPILGTASERKAIERHHQEQRAAYYKRACRPPGLIHAMRAPLDELAAKRERQAEIMRGLSPPYADFLMACARYLNAVSMEIG